LYFAIYFTTAEATIILHPIKSLENLYNLRLLERSEFKPYRLYQYLLLSEVKQPEIVFAQAILESAHFNSKLFLKYKNLFGMKESSRMFSIGENSLGYASYGHWTEAVKDYKAWQSARKYPTANYYDFLEQTGYCELGSKYTELLKGINIKGALYDKR